MKTITSVKIIPGVDQSAEIKKNLEEAGCLILRNLISEDEAMKLKAALKRALSEDDELYGPNYLFQGMVHALMNRGNEFIELISNPTLLSIYRSILGHGCIIHAYNSSSMPPSKTNFSRSIHVDSPRLIEGYITNVAFTLALDPFTNDNGAMEIFPDSFTLKNAPGEEEFDKEKVILNDMKVGDAILFNARCWHRGGINKTTEWRHSVTMNICRSYMRQQFDYCRMMGEEKTSLLPEDVRKFIGYNVRMPVSMSEFLLPSEQRPYKSGQE